MAQACCLEEQGAQAWATIVGSQHHGRCRVTSTEIPPHITDRIGTPTCTATRVHAAERSLPSVDGPMPMLRVFSWTTWAVVVGFHKP